MSHQPASAATRPASPTAAGRQGAILAIVLGLMLAVVAMHSLVLGAVTQMAMPAPASSGRPESDHRMYGGMAADRDAGVAAKAVHAGVSDTVPSTRPTMDGCSNHPCVSTRSYVSVAPGVPPSLIAVVTPSWPRSAARDGTWPGHQTSRAPPRTGPRCFHCVWRV